MVTDAAPAPGPAVAPAPGPAPPLGDLVAALVRERGPSLLDDRRRLLGLLRDKRPAEGPAIRVLMTAFDQDVAARFRDATVSDIDIGREVTRLCAEAGLDRARAREAVETLAMAAAGYRRGAPTQPRPLTWGEPGAPRAPGGRPSVERMAPSAAAAPGAAVPRRGHGRAWLVALATLFLVGAGIGTMRIGRGGPRAPGAPPPPVAGGQRPATGPTARPAPVLVLAEPYTPIPTERVAGSPGTLAAYFALPVGGKPVTFHVAFGFEAGRTHGQAVITAFAGDRAISTGTIGADRVPAAEPDRSYLRAYGPLQDDAADLPSVCVFAQVAPDLDRVDPAPKGVFAAFPLEDGTCDTRKALGYGRLG